MKHKNKRRELLISALGQQDALIILRQLDLTEPTETFLKNMIKALVNYGKVPSKALGQLLEEIEKHVDGDRQAKIEALYLAIEALGRIGLELFGEIKELPIYNDIDTKLKEKQADKSKDYAHFLRELSHVLHELPIRGKSVQSDITPTP